MAEELKEVTPEVTPEVAPVVVPEVNLDDYVPKDVALGWKRSLKEERQRNAEYTAKADEAEEANRIDRIKKLATERGLDDDTRDALTDIAGEIFKSIPKVDRLSAQIDSEIEEYRYEYPDMKSHKEEILKTVKMYRSANSNFNAEDAYRLLKPDKSPRERRTELEQLVAVENENQEPTPQGGTKIVKSLLDDDDRRVLKMMQEAHPDKGWTEEKYLKNTKR